MKGVFKSKAIGVFLVAALIIASTTMLGAAMAASQHAINKEIVTYPLSNQSLGTDYNIPVNELNSMEALPQYPVNEQYQVLSVLGEKMSISDTFNPEAFELPSNGVYKLATENGSIEYVATNNGEIIFLANGDGDGGCWNLETNQIISITIEIDLSADYSDKENGELMVVGYYHNGVFTTISQTEVFLDGEYIGISNARKVMPGVEFSFSAPETGEYCWYIGNYCVGMQNLASVTVSLGDLPEPRETMPETDTRMHPITGEIITR